MKTIIRFMVSLCMMLAICPPVTVHGQSVQCSFTWNGMDGEDAISEEVYPYEGSDFALAHAWKAETVYLKAKITADRDTTVTVSEGVLTGRQEADTIPYSVCFLDSVSAYTGMGVNPAGTHVERNDIISEKTTRDLKAGETAYLWITITAGEHSSGMYQGTIGIQAQETVSLNVKVGVSQYSLANEEVCLDLWQYPYSSYYRYDCLSQEEPFSEAHLAVLRKELEIYHSLGGSAVTCAITEEPWAHQTYYDTPSLITWNIDGNSNLWFDFSRFDRWVELCREAGIDGDIECFSILPFDQDLTIIDDMGNPYRVVLTPGSEEWRWYWETFLYMFCAHLEEKGWLDETVLFVDERGIDYFYLITDFVRSLEYGNRLRFAAALNVTPTDTELYDRFDCLALSIDAIPENNEAFDAFLSHRNELGLKTLLYNCSTNYPNAFLLSDPCESVWTMQYGTMRGFDGYLRWAYNAWPGDPLNYGDNPHFEAGDTFLIYPDEESAANPSPKRSVRLCMIEHGLNEMKKYRYLMNHADEEIKGLLSEGFGNIERVYGRYGRYGIISAGDDADRLVIARETVRLEQLIQKAAHLAALRKQAIDAPGIVQEIRELIES